MFRIFLTLIYLLLVFHLYWTCMIFPVCLAAPLTVRFCIWWVHTYTQLFCQGCKCTQLRISCLWPFHWMAVITLSFLTHRFDMCSLHAWLRVVVEAPESIRTLGDIFIDHIWFITNNHVCGFLSLYAFMILLVVLDMCGLGWSSFVNASIFTATFWSRQLLFSQPSVISLVACTLCTVGYFPFAWASLVVCLLWHTGIIRHWLCVLLCNDL